MFPFDILIKEFRNEEQWSLKWSWNNVYRHSLFGEWLLNLLEN